MEKFLANLKAQAEANPLIAFGVAAALLTAAGKFIDAAGKAAGHRTWAKEVARRERNLPRRS